MAKLKTDPLAESADILTVTVRDNSQLETRTGGKEKERWGDRKAETEKEGTV